MVLALVELARVALDVLAEHAALAIRPPPHPRGPRKLDSPLLTNVLVGVLLS